MNNQESSPIRRSTPAIDEGKKFVSDNYVFSYAELLQDLTFRIVEVYHDHSEIASSIKVPTLEEGIAAVDAGM